MNLLALSFKENRVNLFLPQEERNERASFFLNESEEMLVWITEWEASLDGLFLQLPEEQSDQLYTDYQQLGKILSEKLNLPLVVDQPGQISDAELWQQARENCWKISYFGYHPGKEEYSNESLLTVGNGFIGLRGTTPEMKIGEAHYPATYLAGLYNEVTSEVHGQSIGNEDFVNAPSLQYLSVRIDDEILSFSEEQVLELARSLDLRTGLFESEAILQTAKGKKVKLIMKKIVSMSNRNQYSLAYEVSPLNFNGIVQIISMADGDVYNYNVARYRSLTNHHLIIDEVKADENKARLVAHTSTSNLTIVQESKLFSESGLHWENQIEAKQIIQTAEVQLTEGQTFKVEKSVFVEMITDGSSADQVAGVDVLPDFDTMYQASCHKWQQLWDKSSISIEGDMMSQKMLNLHTYHMLVSGSPLAAPDLDASITARGLHGEAYRGHIFWDELFILPFYILHFPETAKELLMYRYRRLPAAKQAAADAGFQGAMFPWQSGLDGSEQSQEIHLNPVSGKWDEDHSRLQRHVSLAIAYNVWLYYQNTSNIEFMDDYGLELLLEIARFWISIAAYDEVQQRYSINGVMGPDEFHEAYPGQQTGGLKDNAYTNMMVVWLFEEIQKLANELPAEHVKTAKEKTGFTAELMKKMEHIMHQLHLEISPEGIIAQFEGYFGLKEVDWEYYREKYGNIYRMDRILRAEGHSADEYQVAKQADSLMIFYNFEKLRIDQILADLGYQLPQDYLEKNLRYYLSRTSHGSTLSRVVHAQLAAMVGNESLSWKLYQEALYSDYQDIQGGTTAEGIHAGVMAATIYITLTTYGGIDIRQETLNLCPALPHKWQKMSYQLTRRGIHYWLTVFPDKLVIKADQDTAVNVEGISVYLKKHQEKEVLLRQKILAKE